MIYILVDHIISCCIATNLSFFFYTNWYSVSTYKVPMILLAKHVGLEKPENEIFLRSGILISEKVFD